MHGSKRHCKRLDSRQLCMRCLVFSISFEVQCWHDVLTRRTRWSNNLNTCVDIVWILHGFRTRARHTRTLHAHVIRTLHAHATRALLKHPPYSLSAAPSGQPEAGRTPLLASPAIYDLDDHVEIDRSGIHAPPHTPHRSASPAPARPPSGASNSVFVYQVPLAM